MRKSLKIVESSGNPLSDVLADRLFQTVDREKDLCVFFAVDENPFDPRVGALLPFFILSVSRMGGTRFKLRGVVPSPVGRPVVGEALHKATVEYDLATQTGSMCIRD
jgi:hypothetical protein